MILGAQCICMPSAAILTGYSYLSSRSISVVMLILSSCFSDKSNWPYRMTPFFAECPYEEGTFVDEDYHKKVELGGCKHGYFKFFDRGEPNLSGSPIIKFPED